MRKIGILLLAAILAFALVGCDFEEYTDGTLSDSTSFGSLFEENESLSDDLLSNDGKEDNITEDLPSESVNPDEPSTETAQPNVEEDVGIIAPVKYSFSGSYQEAVTKFDNAGFKNVKTVASYELSTGFFASLSLGDVKSISIDGNTNFSSEDKFDENAPVIITYKEYEYKNPDIEFTSYTVDKMMNDAESNELTAKEKYEDKYVAIKGRVDGIDDSGDFYLYPTKDKWAFAGVSCELLGDEQIEYVRKLKKGQVITVKGKITFVSEWGFSLDVYSFK